MSRLKMQDCGLKHSCAAFHATIEHCSNLPESNLCTCPGAGAGAGECSSATRSREFSAASLLASACVARSCSSSSVSCATCISSAAACSHGSTLQPSVLALLPQVPRACGLEMPGRVQQRTGESVRDSHTYASGKNRW